MRATQRGTVWFSPVARVIRAQARGDWVARTRLHPRRAMTRIGWGDLSAELSGGTESAGPARARRQLGGFHEFGALTVCDHEWRDFHAAVDAKGLFAEIDQDRLHFAPVIAVDGAGRIEHGDAMMKCKAGAGPHLCFKTFRQGNCDATGNGRPGFRRE